MSDTCPTCDRATLLEAGSWGMTNLATCPTCGAPVEIVGFDGGPDNPRPQYRHAIDEIRRRMEALTDAEWLVFTGGSTLEFTPRYTSDYPCVVCGAQPTTHLIENRTYCAEHGATESQRLRCRKVDE